MPKVTLKNSRLRMNTTRRNVRTSMRRRFQAKTVSTRVHVAVADRVRPVISSLEKEYLLDLLASSEEGRNTLRKLLHRRLETN